MPGYLYRSGFDRHGGDIFQAWSFDGPRDVRTVCERTVGCAAFNFPWGILKRAIDGKVLPGQRRDVLVAEKCYGMYIRRAGTVRTLVHSVLSASML